MLDNWEYKDYVGLGYDREFDDYMDFLHQMARNLMVELDAKYDRGPNCMSLDEYFCEFRLDYSDIDRISRLLNKF